MSERTRVEGSKYLRSWLALHLVPGMGPVTCRRLLDHFGNPDAVLAAAMAELTSVCRLRRESLEALSAAGRHHLQQQVAAEIRQAAGRNIALLAWDDPRYPPLLKNIHDPPLVLYVLGDPAVLKRRAISIVGSRAATHYGRNIAQNLAESLAGKGFVIVSGMALGIDTAAHKGTLAAAGRTVAVLGCGLDVIYPPGNRALYEDIACSGAVVSEYPFETLPENFRFPARNRIISGLSLGVVVVEAANRSGSLITANHALEQGREVFAVPGRIDSAKSAGTHSLLQQGAKLVHSINDILDEFMDAGSGTKQEEKLPTDTGASAACQLNQEEIELMSFLDVYPRTIDEIVRESGFSPQKTNELLLLLELKGLVQPLPGKAYQKSSAVIQ